MLVTNHALTGALLGSVLPLPVAAPLAFASHFVLDALPHYGEHKSARNSSTPYRTIVFTDTFFALSLNIPAVMHNQWNMIICGWIAYSPDITLIYSYFKNGRSLNDADHISGPLTKFHVKIQYEKPWGIFPELGIAAMLFVLYLHRL